jgi:hypothetical protein
MKDRNEPEFAPVAKPLPAAKLSYVKIGERFGNHPQDSVIVADAELLARLDADGVPYRDATESERRVGGFTD